MTASLIPVGIKIISFDLDDTLWPIAGVIQNAETALHAWLQIHYPRALDRADIDSMRQMRQSVAARFPHNAHDFSFLRHRALIEQLHAAGYDAHVADQAFEVFFAARNAVSAYDDVAEALIRLGRRYRLYALSNGNADLVRCGLAEFFAGHVNARIAGALKPDARIFAHLLAEAGVAAREVLHIGDDPIADVAGAMNAGFNAAWLNREGRAWPADLPAPQLIIESLSELA